MLELKPVDLKKTKITTLIIPVCEDQSILDNRTLAAFVKKTRDIPEFNGKKGEVITFYSPLEINAQRVMCMGLGMLEQLDAESLRSFAGHAVKKCIGNNFEDVSIIMPSEKKIGLDMSIILEAIMEGACLANHVFDYYKEEKKHLPLKNIYFCLKAAEAKKFKSLAERVEIICAGTILARDWVSTPSNDKRPETYAASVAAQARAAGLKVTVLDENNLADQNFGAILAVAQGSTAKPRLVIMEYKAKGAKKTKTLGLVGKGVTFDSGGINLKTGGGLDGMKMDMAGSAAVAATLITLAKLKPQINVVGVIPIVENMPSGTAIRTGDIIKTYSGKTVEIGNTDAEGRLILIDAMAYTIEKYKPDTLIDLATLTGACMVALGDKIAGVFSHDSELTLSIVNSGKKTHERCWAMPLPEDYKDMLKSDFADINNMANARWGGAITAALFLSEFVQNKKWAHIDIAGPAYAKKTNAYCGSGGTGFGVRLLCEFINNL